MELHLLRSVDEFDVGASSARRWRRSACPAKSSCGTARRTFSHIFSGDGYSAGYYSYLWSEVLDADAFDAFREAADIFDAQTAQKLHDFIYAAGNRGSLPPPIDAVRGPHARRSTRC
jgi:peptidyl-dipeptidase Dcp